MPETFTNLRRAVAPEMIETHDRVHPKCLATRAMSSALALPSTGDDFRRAIQAPLVSCSSALTGDRGLAQTGMTKDSGMGFGALRRAFTNSSAEVNSWALEREVRPHRGSATDSRYLLTSSVQRRGCARSAWPEF